MRFEGQAERVAGNGTRGLGGNGGPASAAQLGGAGGLGFDAAGRLYVAEYDDGVRVVERDGTIRTLAGSLGAPHDLAVAQNGAVYVVETHRNRVARVAPDGTVTRLGEVRAPTAIELAPDGSLIVAGADAIVRLRAGQPPQDARRRARDDHGPRARCRAAWSTRRASTGGTWCGSTQRRRVTTFVR